MKHLFNDISKDEKNRILEMHKGANNSKMINEQGNLNPADMSYHDEMEQRGYPFPHRVFKYMIGKQYRFTTKDGKTSFEIRVEDVDETGEGSLGVYFDGDLINKSGESTGGLFNTGTFNNLNMQFFCGERGFLVRDELVGAKNRKLASDMKPIYYNDQLANELNTKYCKVLVQKGFASPNFDPPLRWSR